MRNPADELVRQMMDTPRRQARAVETLIGETDPRREPER
jgi:hypothetical protein